MVQRFCKMILASSLLVVGFGLPGLAEMTEHGEAHEMSVDMTPDGHGEGHMEEHHHETLEIPEGIAVPSIDLTVTPDPVRGWNLHAAVTNFDFAPEAINQNSDPSEGHAHLYIDGEMVRRIYGPWSHLLNLEPGEHEIRVTLNANGHEELTYQGEVIADSVIIEVPEPEDPAQ